MVSKIPLSDRLVTDPVMFMRPENRMPKPMAIVPMRLEFLNLKPMMSTMPMMRARGASVEGLKNCSQEVAESSTSSRRMIWPVTVVPTLAPMTMPRDCLSVMMPAPTRPDVMTMVAVEDWMMAVTRTPSRNALKGLLVTCSMTTFRVPEELSFRPSPIMRMPYRNMAKPPNSEITLKIFIKTLQPTVQKRARLARPLRVRV